MNKYYKGTELRFKVALSADGFSMLDDAWKLEVISGGESVVIMKDDSRVRLINDSYYVYLDTKPLPVGFIRVVGTAYVPDENASGGLREEVAVDYLCELVEA